ncbi:MAG TPA: phage holin family protein [Membranihabitans sp.]|nr:phage holin family protein [Membranihabitans sp.]
MAFLIQLLLSAVLIFILAWFLPGVEVQGYGAAILVALVLAVLQLIVKPILVILTLPITIVTLGLFLLVINAILILIIDAVVPGFSVANFWYALLFSLLLSILGSFFK